jgi:hypothetical protein
MTIPTIQTSSTRILWLTFELSSTPMERFSLTDLSSLVLRQLSKSPLSKSPLNTGKSPIRQLDNPPLSLMGDPPLS